MAATVDSLFSKALALPEDSRLQLLEQLVLTLQIEPALTSEQLRDVWGRTEEVRSGRIKTIPGEQVFQEIQQSLAAQQGHAA